VRKGGMTPYHVVDPTDKTRLLPTRIRRLLLRIAMRQHSLSPAEAVRHINAVRNYARNKTSPRAVAVRAAYTSDIAFLQKMY